MIFKDRKQAGIKLSEKLKKYKNNKDTIVIALPRGGVILGYEVAKDLDLPLDIIVTRKISDLLNPELAIGAITQDGQAILDQNMIRSYSTEKDYIEKQIENEQKEAERRLKVYRAGRKPISFENKIVIIVDDGIATGYTIKAAIKSAKLRNAEKIIVAIPVAPSEVIKEIEKEVDEVICLQEPTTFYAIGSFYKSFTQVEDKEVVELLKKSKIII